LVGNSRTHGWGPTTVAAGGDRPCPYARYALRPLAACGSVSTLPEHTRIPDQPSSLEIRPATAERWSDLADLFERRGPRGGKPVVDGCWCQFWHQRGKGYSAGFGKPNRLRLEEQVRSTPPPGLLAYLDGEAVGWCRLGPREEFERLEASPRLARVDDERVWSVVCFYVHPAAKRQGVASALLEAATGFAAERDAPILEAYAVDAGHANIDAYTGYLPMYLEAGFEPVKDAGRRTIVRRSLT
jgi:GNAT superfamily N-acetyltransferase